MKQILILTIGILALINPQTIIAQGEKVLKVREINYGESRTEKQYESKMKNSPSGHHNTTSYQLQITERTDTINAKLGAQFGIEYELISNQKENTIIQITWIFPDGMKDQKGKTLKELTYNAPKVTNSYTYSNYTLEGENEVVKGQWIFIISKDGKELYRKIFFLI
ncbi:DUF3859 domain-containing protein [Sporocytophaga myxococcoides]|uniref:DUF3859 domain-containing protein n=1 Tax=Sporocytophaga myxococcoides TaxID=153721 RepID=UPI000417CF3F|nr:DUF3859 domain-containing protein [Sporocytophaga myxococcoides]